MKITEEIVHRFTIDIPVKLIDNIYDVCCQNCKNRFTIHVLVINEPDSYFANVLLPEKCLQQL